MRYQSHLDKSAPVAERPAEAEWTREMDGIIAVAVGEASDPEYVSAGIYGWRALVPSYSTDLAAVVRAAEKWCDNTWSYRWSLSNKGGQPGVFMAHVTGVDAKEGSTPALALAKALHAAITAEGEKGKLAHHCVSAKHIDEAAVRSLSDSFGKWRGQG